MAREIPKTTSFSQRQLDLECLQSMDAPSAVFNEVIPSVSNKQTKIVAGPQKLVQRYVVLFTTIVGSDVLDPAFGTTLYARVENGNFGSVNDIIFMARVANSYTKSRILEDDRDESVYGAQPLDEKLEDSWISKVVVDSKSRTISIYVGITTAAGSSITFVVPTEAGIY